MEEILFPLLDSVYDDLEEYGGLMPHMFAGRVDRLMADYKLLTRKKAMEFFARVRKHIMYHFVPGSTHCVKDISHCVTVGGLHYDMRTSDDHTSIRLLNGKGGELKCEMVMWEDEVLVTDGQHR